MNTYLKKTAVTANIKAAMKTERMKRTSKSVVFMLLTLTVFACNQSEQAVIKSTSNEVDLSINKSATNVNIEWGDGTISKIDNGSSKYKLNFLHKYANDKLHTIVVKADGLRYLDCSYNRITDLDVSKCPILGELDCSNNILTRLDLDQCPMLKELECDNNQLTKLDVSKCSVLEKLDCSDNKLTKLDVSKCPVLENLKCDDNQLTKLDVSKCLVLEDLKCDNNVKIRR
jgi:Leucine-rich repeat (LRR) protein